jgi:hypothetical protein
MVTYIRANSNLLEIVKKRKIGQSAAENPKNLGLEFIDYPKREYIIYNNGNTEYI